MDSTASLPFVGLPARRLWEFLRADLVPTPRRWRATLRITLACVAASWPVMAFHLHLALVVMILIAPMVNADVAAQIHARLLLYQEAVPIVQQITRLKLEQ